MKIYVGFSVTLRLINLLREQGIYSLELVPASLCNGFLE
jgi:hypothetical protein